MGRAGGGGGRRRRWAADAEAAWRVRGAVATARDGSTVKAPMGPTSDARQHMISLVGIDFIVEQKYDVVWMLRAGRGRRGVVGCGFNAGSREAPRVEGKAPAIQFRATQTSSVFVLLFCG